MRPGQNRRIRGRNNNNNNRKGPNPLTRSYESNGPDVKIRGNAQHIAEKYAQLARDSQASGDPVAAENYHQHAEHYYRIIAAAQAQFQPAGGQQRYEDGGEDGDGEEESGGFGYGAPQPAVHEAGAPQPEIRSASGEDGSYAPRQREPYRDRGGQDRQNFDRNQRPDQRPDERQDRRDRFRDNPRPAPQPALARDEAGGAGLPAFLTTPVRPPVGVEEANGEAAFAGHAPEGNGDANGSYAARPRRRRGRGRGFGDRPEGEASTEGGAEPSGNDTPTPVE